jgi:predicted SprT family Zn-dependent metalloprotease
MNRAPAEALRPTEARSVGRILRGLGALWAAPALARVGVVLNPRLTRTLGRLVPRQHRIELSRQAFRSSRSLRQVVTHEGAHAALATGGGPPPQRPHGPEWRALMLLAGYPHARGAHWRCRTTVGDTKHPASQARPAGPPAALYDHWCPVCQSSRLGRRPVKAWRCASCTAAGLDGKLEITRRTRCPSPVR